MKLINKSLRKETIYFPTKMSSFVNHKRTIFMSKLKKAIIKSADSIDIFLWIQSLKHPELIDSSVTLVLNYLIVIFKFLATNI